jgi:hypothetical protein
MVECCMPHLNVVYNMFYAVMPSNLGVAYRVEMAYKNEE